jgi:hypothetical protein
MITTAGGKGRDLMWFRPPEVDRSVLARVVQRACADADVIAGAACRVVLASPSPSEWRECGVEGVLLLTYSAGEDVYAFRVYEVPSLALRLEWELYEDLRYLADPWGGAEGPEAAGAAGGGFGSARGRFHVLELEDYMAGFLFASRRSAEAFAEAVAVNGPRSEDDSGRDVLLDFRASATGPSTVSVARGAATRGSRVARERAERERVVREAGDAPARPAEIVGEAEGVGSGGGAETADKALGDQEVGVDETGGLDASHGLPSSLQDLVDKAGLSFADLRDSATAAALLDTLQSEGLIDETEEAEETEEVEVEASADRLEGSEAQQGASGDGRGAEDGERRGGAEGGEGEEEGEEEEGEEDEGEARDTVGELAERRLTIGHAPAPPMSAPPAPAMSSTSSIASSTSSSSSSAPSPSTSSSSAAPPSGAPATTERAESEFVKQRRASSLMRRGLLPPEGGIPPLRGALLAQIRGSEDGEPPTRQLRKVRRVSVAKVATMSKATEANVLSKLRDALSSRRAMLTIQHDDDEDENSNSDWSDD